jgi:hypothetical protein
MTAGLADYYGASWDLSGETALGTFRTHDHADRTFWQA